MAALPTSLRFSGEWRHSQLLALDAFDADVAAGRRSTHIVAPPGSGKTVVGWEIIRRLGHPAVVLCPTTAIQGQWVDKLSLFTAAPGAVLDGPEASVWPLTYQSLCQTTDPGGALRTAAVGRWLAERARATGHTVAEVRAESDGWTGEAAARRDRDLARIVAALKRQIARGGAALGAPAAAADPGDAAGPEDAPDPEDAADLGDAEAVPIDLADLLAPGALARVTALREAGVGTVVLDECHHLASLWGYLVRRIVADLGDVHLVGLTATHPDDLTGEEAALYSDLLGPVDFVVPTPAVVRDGHLAPYQELALFCEPLDSERTWLADRHQRFNDLVDRLHDDAESDLSFPGWVSGRLRGRDDPDADAAVAFADLERRRPALAQAALRFCWSGGLPWPAGAPQGERQRQAPDMDDWIVLLDDYAMRCLRADPGAAAAARLDELGVALRDLGFQLTRQGVRRGGSDVDRVLLHSAAKPIAMVEALAAEQEARGAGLRAVVLCDSERPPRQDPSSPLALSGGGRGMLAAIADDDRLLGTQPLLVSADGLRCRADDRPVLTAALTGLAPGAAWGEPDPDGLCTAMLAGDAAMPAGLAASLLGLGASEIVVGTRGLLGEGWDAPVVNCLLDMTAVAASVSVRQMRGRSLRLDPRDPEKLASNWDVVCVAPELPRGLADYDRFVRRHRHIHAPCADGAIESGPSHVHPLLSPFHPPPAETLAEINRASRERARARDRARELWAIGTPYRGVELDTLVVRGRRAAPGSRTPGSGADADTALTATEPPRVPSPATGPARGAVGLAGLGAAVLAAGLLVSTTLVAAGAILVVAAVAAAVAAARRIAGVLAISPATLPLDRTARAVADACAALDEVSPQAAGSLALQQREGGYVRCTLLEASPVESARFARALEEALAPATGQRYVMSRQLDTPRRAMPAALWAAAGGRAPLPERWHPVPSDLARNRARADAYAAAWRRWIGPGELRYTKTDEAGRAALREARTDLGDWEAQARELWL